MTPQEQLIFQRALWSRNPHAVNHVAHVLHQRGEHHAANALFHRIGCGYGFGVEYGFGIDYAQVQKKLNDLGASPPLDTDGKWGPKSKAACKAFQKSKGLVADGIVGPKTLAALGLSESTEAVASTMGHAAPASGGADAQAYAIAQKAGKAAGMTEQEIQYVVAVARGEGNYGYGWSHPSAKTIELSKKFGLTGYEGANSNNWGAVQGTGSGGTFPHVDTHRDGTPYVGHYKVYKTPDEGFMNMANTILKGGKRGATGAAEIKAAIAKGNLKDAVYAQHANGYFELAPDKYLSAVKSNYEKILGNVGWPRVLAENGITPAIAAVGGGGLLIGLGIGGTLLYLFRKQLGFG